MDVIRAERLTKRYGDLTAVDGITLTVDRPGVVAILGPNGAGKSTTIEMLLGLRTPSDGTVRVFGTEPNAKRTRARVGAMLQESHAPEALTVAETIDLVRHYYPYALTVADLLRRADLAEKRNLRVGQLSGGQKQRLSYALAIAGDPDLLFLDEPTSALDVDARLRFWDQVRGFADQGKTVLFSTHNLDEADALSDRVIVIDRGHVVADGTPAQIKATVAARSVRLTTDAHPDQVRGLDGVRGVEETPVTAESWRPDGSTSGAHRLLVHTSAPEDLLRALFAAGHLVADLSVTDTDLETAFRHLVGTGATATITEETR